METRQHCTLVLDVAPVNLADFDKLLERLSAQGVLFTDLAREQERHADWLVRFTDLDNATRIGDIGAPRTIEQMPARLEFLGVEPNALFLAKLGERYIGYTLFTVEENDASCLRQGWTGVRPEYRRQGIATALKIKGIAYAQQRGYQRIVTEPRIANIPSVGMSVKVGFRLRPEAQAG